MFLPPSRIVSHPKDQKHPELYPLISPPGRPLALGGGRILIPVFIRAPPTLAVYDVAHCLPLGGVGRDFPFPEDETRRHFLYLSASFKEYDYLSYIKKTNSGTDEKLSITFKPLTGKSNSLVKNSYEFISKLKDVGFKKTDTLARIAIIYSQTF